MDPEFRTGATLKEPSAKNHWSYTPKSGKWGDVKAVADQPSQALLASNSRRITAPASSNHAGFCCKTGLLKKYVHSATQARSFVCESGNANGHRSGKCISAQKMVDTTTTATKNKGKKRRRFKNQSKKGKKTTRPWAGNPTISILSCSEIGPNWGNGHPRAEDRPLNCQPYLTTGTRASHSVRNVLPLPGNGIIRIL